MLLTSQFSAAFQSPYLLKLQQEGKHIPHNANRDELKRSRGGIHFMAQSNICQFLDGIVSDAP